ncbi:AbrB family transcriptional regulator [Marinobacterium sp. D7]|uniref:AbrB family transcriptional regulator n=1 Tax=Marinobacterium ramblicola TaxID=2849041 RepID=UPI001C2DA48D|nr:AbrB family transcriptional regulator [Marinobacterium ramblicola]MBV1788663.1 AbrB family transcriptional regulator [Marinobacterium ramblicola]
MTMRFFLTLLWCYLLATCAGYLAYSLNLPLPWMIGPLVVTAAFNLLVRPVNIPVRTRPVGQMIVAAQVGLFFTGEALSAIYDHGLAILGVAICTILFGLSLSYLLRRISNADPVTAFLSCMPGTPVEMGNLAIRYGGDPGPVIFAQTLRISAIVLLIPTTLYYLLDTPAGSRPLNAHSVDLMGMLFMSAGAAASSLLFYKLKINSPFFLGALSFSCIATATGVIPVSGFPWQMVAFAQILLGTWLGSTFRRELFQQAGRLVVSICITSALLLLLCTAFALLLSYFTDMDWKALVLGAAPGSITEMSLTAQFLHQNVALITAFHLVRIFMILPNVPWMLALIHHRANKVARTTDS